MRVICVWHLRQRLWRTMIVGAIVWVGPPLLIWGSALLLAAFGRALIEWP